MRCCAVLFAQRLNPEIDRGISVGLGGGLLWIMYTAFIRGLLCGEV